jgi:hypothetical protein
MLRHLRLRQCSATRINLNFLHAGPTAPPGFGIWIQVTTHSHWHHLEMKSLHHILLLLCRHLITHEGIRSAGLDHLLLTLLTSVTRKIYQVTRECTQRLARSCLY